MIENSIQSGLTMRDGSGYSILARIDQYELVRELGGGGFGTVYLANDTVSGVEYAVKGLPSFVKNNREEMENIRVNFALVSRLSHTNIARAHVLHPAREVHYSSEDVRRKLRVESGDTLMVMEYAPGETLSQWRKQFPARKVPIAQALEIAQQIASALDYAHEQKILHRDIKPANVMIETKPDGKLVARVLDFGLAAEIRSSMGQVSQEIHDTSGTRPYMAPEQWMGDRQGPGTDQYALAVLFHELVTGYVPFASVFDTGDPVVMMNVIRGEFAKLPSELPSLLRRALGKALAKNPEERFVTCGDFVAALEGNPVPRKPLPNPNNGSRWKATALLACVAAIAIGAWWWMKKPMPTDEGTSIQTPLKDTDNAAQANDELKREVFLMKGKASQARDRNEKEEWHSWPHFDRKAKDLESFYRAGVDAFDREEYPLAKEMFERVRENITWLVSNKNVRIAALAASEKAEADIKDTARTGGKDRLAKLSRRGKVKSAINGGNLQVALTLAEELTDCSVEKEDCALWVDTWLKVNGRASGSYAAKMQLTEKYHKYLLEERRSIFDLRSLAQTDLDSPLVLNMLGLLFEYGENGTKENKGIAREFYERAVKAGYAKSEKRLAEIEEDLRCNPIFDVVLSGNFDRIKEVVTERNPRKDVVRRSGYTLMHAAAFGGDAEVLEYFDKIGYDFNVQDKDGAIPFFVACANTNSERAVSAVQWFVEKKSVDVNYHNTLTNSYATVYGIQNVKLEKVFDYLVSHGARTDVKDNQGKSLLHIYVNGTHELGLVRKALGVLDVAAVDDDGYQPIHYAATSRSERPSDLIELLVANGADVNARIVKGSKKDYWESYTPLHCACVGSFAKKDKWKQGEIVKALIKHGANLNAVSTAGTWDGYTPLCMAAKDCESEIVGLLIEAGADQKFRAKGYQPIHLAASKADEEGCCETLAALLKHGGSINAVISGSKYDDGDSVLHAAIDHFYGNGRPVPENNLKKVIKFLILNGANKEATGADGCTPFLMAAKGGKIAAMEALVESGVNVNARVSSANKYRAGYKALHLVADDPDEEWSIPVAEWLLLHGAGINDIVTGNGSRVGENAVLIAVDASAYKEEGERRKMQFIKFLIGNGADKEATDADGYTPFLRAAKGGKIAAIRALAESGVNVNARVSSASNYRKGYKALHLVADDPDEEWSIPVAEFLLSHGAGVNDIVTGDDNSHAGENALHIAIEASAYKEEGERRKMQFIRFLIARGANKYNKDKWGKTVYENAKSYQLKQLLR